ncbi:MAG: hypothetical protein RJA34_1512 [Pseudomonadota bacterium]|jgi:hypothetical protein
MSIDYDSLRQAMHILGTPLIDEFIADECIHRFSTNGRRNNRDGWYVIHLYPALCVVFGCWRSGGIHYWRPEPALRSRGSILQVSTTEARRKKEYLLAQAQKQRDQWAFNAEKNRKLAAQCGPAGKAVRQYLDARGLAAWAIPACILEHPALPYWHQNESGQWVELGTFPAMIAPVMLNGKVLAYHRTYLGKGCKAAVPQPKKLTRASGPLSGSVIPLAPPHKGVLGIAEGIETAAAASVMFDMPVVVACGTSALSTFIWPGEVERMVIFADNDTAGIQAARKLAERANQHGLHYETMKPNVPGADWADIWIGDQA